MSMTINRLLRLVAGAFVTLTALLAAVHSLHWLWLTAFVGLNLFQSAFTNWCPMMAILRRLGVNDDTGEASGARS